MVKFVAMIQLEDVYDNIGHACFTAGKWDFYSNMSKTLSLTTISLNIICGNENGDNINKLFATAKKI